MGDFKRKLFSWKWKEQKVVTLLLEIKKKGDILYAICLKVSQNSQITIQSLGEIKGKIESVSVLGNDFPVSWCWDGDRLLIDYSVPELPVPIHLFKIIVNKY